MKSFSGASAVQDFKLALGQYLIYRTFLDEVAPERKLFLAVPAEAYRSFFAQVAIELVIKRFAVSLLVVDVATEEVLAWTS